MTLGKCFLWSMFDVEMVRRLKNRDDVGEALIVDEVKNLLDFTDVNGINLQIKTLVPSIS